MNSKLPFILMYFLFKNRVYLQESFGYFNPKGIRSISYAFQMFLFLIFGVGSTRLSWKWNLYVFLFVSLLQLVCYNYFLLSISTFVC